MVDCKYEFQATHRNEPNEFQWQTPYHPTNIQAHPIPLNAVMYTNIFKEHRIKRGYTQWTSKAIALSTVIYTMLAKVLLVRNDKIFLVCKLLHGNFDIKMHILYNLSENHVSSILYNGLSYVMLQYNKWIFVKFTFPRNPFKRHWGRHKIATILQTIISISFSCMSIIVIWFNFD